MVILHKASNDISNKYMPADNIVEGIVRKGRCFKAQNVNNVKNIYKIK